MIDFIGLGAQKSGTSWAYTCLYEHPEVCTPIKELHFFSRPRYENGISWYEKHFASCDTKKKKGEWSTSYLYSDVAAERIHAHYPHTKLLMILRNPIDRAYSQYRNAIRAGEISKGMSFSEYKRNEKSVYEQGLYAAQIERFLTYFKREQLYIAVYEDIRKDPVAFMREIYLFLGIDPHFVASMTHSEVNVARTPTVVGVDRFMHHVSEFLRKHGFDQFVHMIRKTGIPDRVRSVNTAQTKNDHLTETEKDELRHFFKKDVMELSTLLGRDLCAEWNI